MSLRIRISMLAIGLVALWTSAAAVFAQPKPPAKPPEAVALKGTIEMLGSQGGQTGIKLTTSEGQSWVAICNKASKIRVVGTAKPDFLRPGLNVRFNALADRKLGKLKDEKLTKMTLFTVSQEFQMGIFPDPTGKSDDENFKVYDLNGTITSVKGNVVTISVPGFNPKLHTELTDATAIDFNFGDLMWVKQGDTLEGRGTKMDMPPMPQQRPQGRQMPGGRMQPGMQPGMQQGAAGRRGPGVTPGLGGGFQGPGAPAAGGQAGAGAQTPAAAAAAAVGGEMKMPSFCSLQEGKITKAEPLSGGGGSAKARGTTSTRGKKEKAEGGDAKTPAK